MPHVATPLCVTAVYVPVPPSVAALLCVATHLSLHYLLLQHCSVWLPMYGLNCSQGQHCHLSLSLCGCTAVAALLCVCPICGRPSLADLFCVTTLLSGAATMSFYTLTLPYVGRYRCRWFCSAPDALTTPCFASAHIYLSEKVWRVDRTRNT